MHGLERYVMQTFAVDPNLAYIILLVGLWGAVTAAYIPGTGVAELGAAAISIFAIILMASLPTNWVAVLGVVFGVLGFLVMPFINHRWLLLAVAGLILQALGSVRRFSFEAGRLALTYTLDGNVGTLLFERQGASAR